MSALKAFGGGKRRPINLFFAEIIIALLFFSISGAVIIKVFASADMKSQQSARLERVMIIAQSIAEAYSESGYFRSSAELVLGDDFVVEDCISLAGGGTTTTAVFENGSVHLRAYESSHFMGAGKIYDLTMTFAVNDEEIYSLECSAYTRNGGEPGE
ncbi:MAG: hypothetical protein HDR72_07215 [Ruminococcaceae bacterium]|nr:hypothetical protein [Oscillospiraceae bacterium]